MSRFLINAALIAAAAVVLMLLNPHMMGNLGPYQLGILNKAGIFIILAVSLNLINGYTGQFSIGHLGFTAVGAYTSAAYVKYLAPAGWDPQLSLVVSLVVAGLMAAACGVVVGLPTLRLKGDYLAIATLGFGEIIRVVLLNLETVNVAGQSIDLGGARGFTGIAHISNFFWIYFSAFITVVVVLNIVNSSPGRAFKSIREDELASEVMGINTTYYKVVSFVIGAFFAGLAGGLWAHEFQVLHPARFNFIASFDVVVMVVLGGMGSTTGVILSAVFLTYLPEWLRSWEQYRLVIYSLALIIMMLVRPQGLMGTRELSVRFLDRFRGRSDKADPRQGVTA